MRGKLWIWYVVAALSVVGAYYASGQTDVIFHLIGMSAAVAIVVGVRVHRPSHRQPWMLFAIGQLLFVAGDVLSYNYERFFGTELPYPAISDVFYLLVYPCLVAGLLLILRRRSAGRDRGSLIDSSMFAIGIGIVTWVVLISPYVHDTTMTGIEKATAMAYPLMDLLLLAVAMRLAAGAGRKATAFNLIVVGVAALFITDAIYGWMLLHNGYTPGVGLLEIGWALFYILLGAAALHPSMRTVSEPSQQAEPRISAVRLGLLGAACLLAPAVQAWSIARGDGSDTSVILGATIVLFLLAVVRMGGLVRQQEQSARRDRALREVGSALVTATNRDGIYEATLEAAKTVAGPRALLRVLTVDGDEATVVAADRGDVHGVVVPFAELEEWKHARLREHRSYHVPSASFRFREELDIPADDGTVLVAPMFVGDALHAVMVAALPERITQAVTYTIEALASQAALALESAVLTEELLLKQSEARFASLVRNASDVITTVDSDTTITYASPSSRRALGYDPATLEGTRFIDLVHDDDKTRAMSYLTADSPDGEGAASTLEIRVRRSDGGYIYAETQGTNLLHDPNVRGIVLTTRDVSERREFEEQLSHQAFHDSLTGLANRVLFRDRVSHALERQQRDRKPVAVLFMDVDDFKTINDSLGHAAGDVLLREVGDRIREALRGPDTAARLGGDEFAVLLEDGGDGIAAADVAERLIVALVDPFHLEGKEVFVRASIGIAVAEADAAPIDGVESLMRNADVAMYMAKEKGKNRYQMFEPAMHETALRRLQLKADLQRALEHKEFILQYQPVIELDTGRISGVEALIRWMHPERGLVPPLDFIPLAEETGLIVPIGRWVLEEACRYAARLHERFPSEPPLHMAVNLSAKQLARAEIVPDIKSILETTELASHSLILEITESVMMADMELSIVRLRELKELGVQIAIDDFGTGYSSLNYVRRFPVDILKVDKSFIDGVSDDGESSALTAAVIELAGILSLKPVAEGIERLDQLQRLLELHCAFGQGYYFAKPLIESELEGMITEHLTMESEAGLRQMT